VKVRLTAILLTIGVAIFVVLAFAFVVVGPTFIDRIASMVGLGHAFAVTWNLLRWPIALALVALGIGLVYYFAPDAEQDWEWITPGAVVATVLWLAASLGFKFYVANFANYNESYGSLGGVIILMLWFYMSAVAILLGAEMNAEIEHASPYGKDEGEKVPGEKKKIGAAAKRAWEQRRRLGLHGRSSKPLVRGPEENLPAPHHPDRRPASGSSPKESGASLAAYAVVAVGLWRRLRRKSDPPRERGTRPTLQI
jgi:hypothetical protein